MMLTILIRTINLLLSTMNALKVELARLEKEFSAFVERLQQEATQLPLQETLKFLPEEARPADTIPVEYSQQVVILRDPKFSHLGYPVFLHARGYGLEIPLIDNYEYAMTRSPTGCKYSDPVIRSFAFADMYLRNTRGEPRDEERVKAYLTALVTACHTAGITHLYIENSSHWNSCYSRELREVMDTLGVRNFEFTDWQAWLHFPYGPLTDKEYASMSPLMRFVRSR